MHLQQQAVSDHGIEKRCESWRLLVSRHIRATLREYSFPDKQIADVCLYALNSTGHLWRPILCLYIHARLSREEASPRISNLAAAAEFLHTASIILDDIMDDATLRRNQEPCYLRYGEGLTILASHWLCDLAQSLIHNSDYPKRKSTADLEELFRSTKKEMILGQASDMEECEMTLEEIIEKCRRKSGALYAFAAAAPSLLLDCPKSSVDHLVEFGYNLGIAYQIADDIHDVEGSVEASGKDVGKDVGKPTIPRVYGRDKALEIWHEYRKRALKEIDELIETQEESRDLVARICLFHSR